MDRRRLMSRKTLLPLSQLSERAETVSSNKQTTPTQERNRSFDGDDDESSHARSSVLKPSNHLPQNISSINKSRKRNFCEIDNDTSEKDNFRVGGKLSRTKVSVTREANNQVSSGGTSDAASQQENNGLLGNRKPETRKQSGIAGAPAKEKSVTGRDTSLEQQALDDLDLSSCDESTVVRKKQGEIVYGRHAQHIGAGDNSDRNSPEKVLPSIHKSSPAKSAARCNISGKKQHAESNSCVESEKSRGNTRVEHVSRSQSRSRSSIFLNFLQKSGITLSANDVYVLNVSLSTAKRKMKKVLNLRQYQKKDIIESMEQYIQSEENFQKMLNDMELLSVDNRSFSVLTSTSLAKILLEVTEIQTDVYNVFISKLNESVLLADIPEKIPWAVLLLHQFRFLNTIADVEALTANMEQLLETSPLWFQHEIILFLPDMLSDTQHQRIAEILTNMLEENCELTAAILNCITSFNLSREYLEEYKLKILHLLKTNMKVEFIPTVIKFLLNDCTSPEIVKQLVLALRDTETQPLAGDGIEDHYKNQVQIAKTLKICMLLNKEITHSAMKVIKDIDRSPKPFDLIVLLLIFGGAVKQKNAEALLKQNVQCGFYRISLLHALYNDYKQVVRELQPSVLQLASKLLKSKEYVFVSFATEWFRLQFVSQKETSFRQREIVEKIILLMGNNDQTMKHTLAALCKMAENTTERDCLVTHCNHLRILLEKIDCFGLEEVGILSDLLHRLCLIDDSTSELLRDDLFILLQKQLSAAKPITKCKGVMGAVMAIKHLAVKAETSDRALKLFNKVMKSVRSCSKSLPLFYDQLAQIIAETELIDADFLRTIRNRIEDEFVNTYMVDKRQQHGEDLVPRFGLNNVESEPQSCVINFGNKKSGPVAPILFRLLKTCCVRLSTHGELEAIDALLGCEMLMPQSFDVPEHSVLDLVICGINWFREVITGFVTQTDPLLQDQVLQRLDNLIYLQGELNTLLLLCDTKYQPPPCYFHYFPLPPFVTIERKTSKKGQKTSKKNKSSSAAENASREFGSTLCSKNPAYFRKFDAKIAHLLDVKMESRSTQSSQLGAQNISTKQASFVVRELLAIFETEGSEYFVKELIHLLPKICAKVDDVIGKLRRNNTHELREAAGLLLCLLAKIFNWKGFFSVTYNTLLREGLRTLARQVDEKNAQLRSCKELVAESYKYFESLSDVATEISLATALVNMCQSLMKHSETYTQQYKNKHAKLAYGFLCLEWFEDRHTGPQYRLFINQLLSNWIDNETSPMDTVTSILKWLPDEVSDLQDSGSNLTRIPSINKNTFHLLYKKLFDGFIKGINISLSTVNSDPRRIQVWRNVASNVQKLIQICKTLRAKAIIQMFLRHMPLLIKQFLNTGMPILEHNLKYQTDDVISILKIMQSGTRYLSAICVDGIEKKNLPMTKYMPAAKSLAEKLLYRVKAMMVLNDSGSAFWMGNLVNKNLDGREILSQTSEETTLPEAISEEVNASSEILDSDLDEDPMEETDNEDDEDIDL